MILHVLPFLNNKYKFASEEEEKDYGIELSSID